MSIPGLGQTAPTAASAAPAAETVTEVHQLAANSEWRFEAEMGGKVDLKVLSGTAEIFGTELAVNHLYTFRGIYAAVFTWHGCRLEVTGASEEAYTVDETPMIQYANVHFALEKLRDEAAQAGREGPRVLVVGQQNSGKTSLVKLLTAYALRQGRQPMVINTDTREGLLSIPGTMTATPFASIIDVEQGWGTSPTSTSTPVPVKLPLCYYFGVPNPEDNAKLYKSIVTRLALAAASRLADDAAIRATGMIIDTPGVISQGKGGFELISHIVSEFAVNTIIVIGSERTHSEMVRRFSAYRTSTGESITLVKLDKSGGCIDRSDVFMQQINEVAIKAYFFGDAKTTLSPHTQMIGYDDLLIYKIRESHTNSFLPGGMEETEQGLYEKVEPNPSMQHCVLAVMYASLADSQEAIRDASVMGFVYISEVIEEKRRLKILAPLNTRVSDRPLIWGSWPEAAVSLMG